MVQKIKNNIASIDYREQKLFWYLFGIFFILLASYGFLVESTIRHALSIEAMQRDGAALSATVDTLESKYLALENTITPAAATAEGFVPANVNTIAVLSGTPAVAVSMNAR